MGMLLIWRPDTNPAHYTDAEATNYLWMDARGFNPWACRPIPPSLPPLKINITSRREPADFFHGAPVMIVSAELKEALQEFDVKVEFPPIKTTRLGKRYTKKQYFFFNILEVVDCFDYRQSRYTRTTHGVHEIDPLVLSKSKATGYHLFRLGPLPTSEPNPKAIRDLIICVSEELAARVEDAGLTGVAFTRPEDRLFYPPPPWRKRS
jgi:hypothetical protein